jgi:hypothetical protein
MKLYLLIHKQFVHYEDQILQQEKNNSLTKLIKYSNWSWKINVVNTSITIRIHSSVVTKFDGGFQEKFKTSLFSSLVDRQLDEGIFSWIVKSN